MPNISDIITKRQYVVKKPRKDDRKRELRQRLSDLTGRTTKSIWGSTIIWSVEMLEDSIGACQHYQDIKARNFHFNEYIKETKTI